MLPSVDGMTWKMLMYFYSPFLVSGHLVSSSGLLELLLGTPIQHGNYVASYIHVVLTIQIYIHPNDTKHPFGMAYGIIQILKVQIQMVQIIQICSSTVQFYIGETGIYRPDILQHGPYFDGS